MAPEVLLMPPMYPSSTDSGHVPVVYSATSRPPSLGGRLFPPCRPPAQSAWHCRSGLDEREPGCQACHAVCPPGGLPEPPPLALMSAVRAFIRNARTETRPWRASRKIRGQPA
jgi:hypothetical protein